MNQEELKELFVYSDGRLLCRKTNKQYSIRICNGKEHLLYKQKLYCLDVLIYLYFTGEYHKYIQHIDGNLLNNKIENLYIKKNPVNEFNRLSYPQINSLEELKEIFNTHIFKEDGFPNQHSFSVKWWGKRNMPYMFFVIEEFKRKYGIEDNIQFVYHVMNDIKEIPLCEVCNTNQKIWYTYTVGYKTTCSVKCAHNHPTKQQKRKTTCNQLYGVDHISKLSDIKQKKQVSCLKNYGVDNPSKSSTIQQRKTNTSFEKHGVLYTQQKDFPKETIVLLEDKRYLETQILELNLPLLDVAKNLGISTPTLSKALKKFDIVVPTTEKKRVNKRKRENKLKELPFLDCTDFPLLQDFEWMYEHCSENPIWEVSKNIDVYPEKVLYWAKQHNIIQEFSIESYQKEDPSIHSIYKATCLINGKCYIGYTTNFYIRYMTHRKSSVYKKDVRYYNKFYTAIRKYGFENFMWEILYQSKDGDHCWNVMEPYFIRENNSYFKSENSNGYNMTIGGKGTNKNTGDIN